MIVAIQMLIMDGITMTGFGLNHGLIPQKLRVFLSVPVVRAIVGKVICLLASISGLIPMMCHL